MKLTLLIVSTLLIFSTWGQSVKLISITPTSVNGYDTNATNDDGVRTLNVTLELYGKGRNLMYPFAINSDNALSRPKLLDSFIMINNITFRRNYLIRLLTK